MRILLKSIFFVLNYNFSVNAALIEQGYQTINLIVKEFLGILPFDCIQILVETDAKYGKQPFDLNVALAAVGQLVTHIFYFYN